MMLKIFAVRDNAVAAYLQPFFSPTNGAALRSLKEAVNDPKHEFHKHANDYTLWSIGEYDDATGSISPLPDGPQCLIKCVDLLGVD